MAAGRQASGHQGRDDRRHPGWNIDLIDRCGDDGGEAGIDDPVSGHLLVVALRVADMSVARPPGSVTGRRIRRLSACWRRLSVEIERSLVPNKRWRRCRNCSLWLAMDRSLLRARDEQAESGFRRGVLDDGRFCYGGNPRAMLADSSIRIGGDGCQSFPKRLICKANFSE